MDDNPSSGIEEAATPGAAASSIPATILASFFDSQKRFNPHTSTAAERRTPKPKSNSSHRVGLVEPTPREQAEVRQINNDTEMRMEFAREIKKIFALLNRWLFSLIAVAAIFDCLMIFKGVYDSSNRFISDRVILALIAGTVAQVGAAFFAIVKYLFPKPKEVNITDLTDQQPDEAQSGKRESETS